MEAHSQGVGEAVEERSFQEVLQTLATLEKLQRLLLPSFRADELADAQGRRCILKMTGAGRDHTLFFQVDGTGIRLVEPFDNFNTYIEAPVASVLRVFKGVLDGNGDAFAMEWARGGARVVGERSIHDGIVFASVFQRLAELIRRYRES